MKVKADLLKKVMNCGDENTEISIEFENCGNKYLGKSLLLDMPACADIDISEIVIDPDEEDYGKVAYITMRLTSWIDAADRKLIDERWNDFVQREYRRIYGKEQDSK